MLASHFTSLRARKSVARPPGAGVVMGSCGVLSRVTFGVDWCDCCVGGISMTDVASSACVCGG